MGNELIVKFKEDSELHKATVAASQNGVQLNQHLIMLESSLSKQINLPLHIRHITYGQELLLVIDFEKLMFQIIQTLQNHPQVKNATLVFEYRKNIYQKNQSIMVEFMEDSQIAKMLSKKIEREESKKNTIPQNFIQVLEKDTGIKFVLQSLSGKSFLIGNVTSQFGRLSEYLSKRSDVEYFQPNFIFQHQ